MILFALDVVCLCVRDMRKRLLYELVDITDSEPTIPCIHFNSFQCIEEIIPHGMFDVKWYSTLTDEFDTVYK